MKEKIALWYRQALWNAEMVQQAVDKGLLTPEDYSEITGT